LAAAEKKNNILLKCKNMFEFKKTHTLKKRKEESKRIRLKYPNRVPVIVQAVDMELDRQKYLVPADLTIGQFLRVLRKRVKLREEQALYIFLENKSFPAVSEVLSSIYQRHKNPDEFLYFLLYKEDVFG
jgi:GABA(A) receptor-associated protein